MIRKLIKKIGKPVMFNIKLLNIAVSHQFWIFVLLYGIYAFIQVRRKLGDACFFIYVIDLKCTY